MSRDFYLVQRLTRRDFGSAKGFDRMFGCQYMGSAEFEWGAIPDSLGRIRSSKVVLYEGVVTRKGVTVPVFVVGDKRAVKSIPDRLTAWMVDEYPRGKERSYFPEYVDGTNTEYSTADAWWALDEDVLWTLNRDIADDLLTALGGAR